MRVQLQAQERTGLRLLGVALALIAFGCQTEDANDMVEPPSSTGSIGMGEGRMEGAPWRDSDGAVADIGGEPDSGSLDPLDAGLAPTGDQGGGAGEEDSADAAVGDDDTPPPVDECAPEELKAAEGEACLDDAECQAGLLCGDTNGEPGVCRPIDGLTLLRTFRPQGRRQAASAVGGRGEYSEGIDFGHGFLWQATPYVLHQIDVEAHAVVISYDTPSEIDYREGIAWRGDTLLQASYRNINIYAAQLQPDMGIGAFSMYRELEALSSAALLQTQERRNCVYGIEDHCDVLYTTRCGDRYIDTYAAGAGGDPLETFEVRDEAGRPLPAVEDMELYLGQLWISTFAGDRFGYQNVLFRVDLGEAAQGMATAVDAYEIQPCADRSGTPTIALDGVAVNRATRELYVTGKDCPIIVYEVH